MKCSSTFGVSSSRYGSFSVTMSGMTKTSGAMHVAKITNRRVDKSGQPREYVSHLLRRTYRDGSKVKHETLANLSPLPEAAIDAVRAALAGKTLVVAGEGLEVTGSRPHGHVAAVHAQAKALGLPALLGPAGPVLWPGRGPRRRAHAVGNRSPPVLHLRPPASYRPARPAPPRSRPLATGTGWPGSRA